MFYSVDFDEAQYTCQVTALVAGTYYVKEITAPKGYVLSGTVHTLTVKAGQTTGISATDKELSLIHI